MRLPRNISGDDLVKALSHYGYEVTRQTGSHVRLTRKIACEADTENRGKEISPYHSKPQTNQSWNPQQYPERSLDTS